MAVKPKSTARWYHKVTFQATLISTIPAFLVAVFGIAIQAYYANQQIIQSNLQNEKAANEKAKLDSLQSKKDRVNLIITCWKIMESFPANGVSAFDNYSSSQKIYWAKGIITLLETEVHNEVLLKDEAAMDRWLNAINALRMTILIISDNLKPNPSDHVEKELSKDRINEEFRQCGLEVADTYMFVQSRIGDKSFTPANGK